VSRTTGKLAEDSKKFRWSAKRLNLLDAWRKYAPLVLAVVIVLAVLWWRFFW
jgi:hypothetical protein